MESPPFSWFASDDRSQIVMFGLENAGKTTLLYRLKVKDWKRQEIVKDMEVLKCMDPSYHYEEFPGSGSHKAYGIWDIPGGEVMRRMWPMFYRYLRISAVLFVVNTKDETVEDLEKMELNRRLLHFLLNEDELRCAAFVVVLNTELTREAFESDSEEARNEIEKHNAICNALNIPFLKTLQPHKGRLTVAPINCSEISRYDPEWEAVIRGIETSLGTIAQGINLHVASD